MMKLNRMPKQQGFSLIELMLVLVIVSAFMVMGMNYMQQRTLNLKLDKTAAQMQQILNAALSYYVNNGSWPANFNCLKGTGAGCTQAYLPSTLTNNPFGGTYTAVPAASGTTFYVSTAISSSSAPAYSLVVAGKLPSALTANSITGGITPVTTPCSAASTTCSVLSSVPIPGQNAASATAVNFAGLYHNGACVPTPICPSGTTPQIMAVPAAVSGTFEAPTGGSPCTVNDTSGCTVRSYPITSYTARATAATAATAGGGPPSCRTGASAPCLQSLSPASNITSGTYWRVCLDVITEAGRVEPVAAAQTQGLLSGTVMAITRCAIPSETTGSGFTVWAQ